MSPDIIILLLGLVALMALGIPICFAMMSVASVILLVFYGSGLLNVLNAAFVYQMQSESLLAIPHVRSDGGVPPDLRHRRRHLRILPQVAWRYQWRSGYGHSGHHGSHRRYERCGGHRYHHDGADCTASYVGPWL